ncbi:hypothetical protein Tco_1449757 [Tanacetum coccineum]
MIFFPYKMASSKSQIIAPPTLKSLISTGFWVLLLSRSQEFRVVILIPKLRYGYGYQEEREEHVNVENVVELESNTEEKPKKTRATHTKIHGTSTLRGHLKFFPKFPENMLDGQTQLSIQKGDGDDRKMIARKFNQQSIRSHWGVDIGKAVEMCLLKWGIESNVFTIIVGNASAKDVVVVNLKSKFAN